MNTLSVWKLVVFASF